MTILRQHVSCLWNLTYGSGVQWKYAEWNLTYENGSQRKLVTGRENADVPKKHTPMWQFEI